MWLILKYRRSVIVMFHLALVIAANYLAFWLRFDGAILNPEIEMLTRTLPWLLLVRGLTFIPFRLYQGLWRYTSIWDLRNITLGVLSSTPIFYGITRWGLGIAGYPRSVYIIDTLLLIVFLGGVRLTRRIYRELGKEEREKRVLIYGAGDAGERIIWNMKNHDDLNEPIGIVDDDPNKVGQRIHGVRVLGTRQDLEKIIASTEPHEIVIAIPSVQPAQLRGIVRALEPFKVPIKTLPSIRDILNGQVTVTQIRDLSMEDLLLRTPMGLDPEPIRHLVEGKRVLVTGAGGSIGSELCRQIAGLHPEALILYERYENGLYAIMNDLTSHNERNGSNGDIEHCQFYPVIGDITDVKRLEKVMTDHRPHIIFHAAAHKHVPLMELNPCEAVKNNVTGTYRVADVAQRFQVERFILISSDKAVNPSSVMGATKRVTEFLIQSMNQHSPTVFIAVRFGNVLGSNGSVVPLFIEQIQAGKPVTITHPEMRRYFMLIPEAVCLILHAGAIGHGGDVYVLDMGEQIKMVDLARNLIRLAGFVPEKEIPIHFIGLRPGEKLSEDLVGIDEIVEPSPVEKINRIRAATVPVFHTLMTQIRELDRLAVQGDVSRVIKQLCEIVPTFEPSEFPPSPTLISP